MTEGKLTLPVIYALKSTGDEEMLWVGDPQARLSRCPKVSQSKNLAVVNYFLFHSHFSYIFFSSFTIRSRFFAVFIKVGR